MSKFEVGEIVDNAADDHEGGPVIAVFPTVDGNFRYAVDMEGYGALQFFAEEKLVVHPSGTRATSVRPQPDGVSHVDRCCRKSLLGITNEIF